MTAQQFYPVAIFYQLAMAAPTAYAFSLCYRTAWPEDAPEKEADETLKVSGLCKWWGGIVSVLMFFMTLQWWVNPNGNMDSDGMNKEMMPLFSKTWHRNSPEGTGAGQGGNYFLDAITLYIGNRFIAYAGLYWFALMHNGHCLKFFSAYFFSLVLMNIMDITGSLMYDERDSAKWGLVGVAGVALILNSICAK
jgi:hypothetical protein